MKRYIGTKIIQAFPESKGPMPGGEEGYAVIYEDGYRSWSPKAVFEAAYKERPAIEGLQPHQQRVVDEKTDLDEKANALSQFIGCNPIFGTLAPAEQELLKLQNDVMWQYSTILSARIAAF